jgi:hypothetical protein
LSDVLESFYEVAPVQMQCTKASGEQLPGRWTHMEKPDLQLEGEYKILDTFKFHSESIIYF